MLILSVYCFISILTKQDTGLISFKYLAQGTLQLLTLLFSCWQYSKVNLAHPENNRQVKAQGLPGCQIWAGRYTTVRYNISPFALVKYSVINQCTMDCYRHILNLSTYVFTLEYVHGYLVVLNLYNLF